MNSTILVIENDHEIRQAIRESLENVGHKVLSATNIPEGLILLKKIGCLDFIVLNMMFSDANGVEFLKAKDSYDRFRSIPLVMHNSLKPLDLNVIHYQINSFLMFKKEA